MTHLRIKVKIIWKDELAQKKEGIEILKMIQEIEEAFVHSLLRDRFDKPENILKVIHKRTKGIFSLMEYISKEKQKTE